MINMRIMINTRIGRIRRMPLLEGVQRVNLKKVKEMINAYIFYIPHIPVYQLLTRS